MREILLAIQEIKNLLDSGEELDNALNSMQEKYLFDYWDMVDVTKNFKITS